jgi:UDP-N-acetylglucosamine 2-epimerase (non-hydrolysing)
MTRRILVIFGTRPEAIKLFPVVRALAMRPDLLVRTCVTAQHRGLLDQVLAVAELVPDIDLDLMEPGQSLDRLTARLLTGLGEVMDRERPDLVIVQGDTATAMPVRSPPTTGGCRSRTSRRGCVRATSIIPGPRR